MAKVTKNQVGKIMFSQVQPSEIFVFEGKVCMKLSYSVPEYNFVCFEDGTVDYIFPNVLVTEITNSITLENT